MPRPYRLSSSCTAFNPRQSIQSNIETCDKCLKKTCAVCKVATHDRDCPPDDNVLEILRITEKNGRKKCSSCHMAVELTFGCDHISKVGCGFFNFQVDRNVHTGSLPILSLNPSMFVQSGILLTLWTIMANMQIPFLGRRVPASLWTAPNVAVNGAAARRPNAETNRTAVVDRVKRNLVRNTHCRHLSWTCRRGRHECEQCHDVPPVFMFECHGCSILACGRCEYHRLLGAHL